MRVERPIPRLVGGFMIFTLVVGCTAAESSDDLGGAVVADAGEILNVSDAMPADEAMGEADNRPKPAPEPAPRAIPAVVSGTQMTFRIAESLSTESNVSGDRFLLTLVDDVLSPEGDVLVPAGSAGEGIVAVAEESQGSGEPAVLQLQLVSMEIDGELRSVVATVVAADVKIETRDSGGETAAKIGLGTAVGAFVGGIIGRDRRGALTGAGAGAVGAGTAVTVATDEGHARIDEGSTVTVVVDERLEVE